MNIYEGDPKIVLGPNGSRIVYKGGQPVMDRGIENSVFVDLGTKKRGVDSHQKGWVGNYLMRDPDQRIGTDYQDTFENQPITLAGLATREQTTKAALKGAIYGAVSSKVTNPNTDKIINKILIGPPAGAFEFRTETFSQLWQFQATEPANERI